jgi:alkylated DNA repair protein alkB family protein 6
VPDFISAADERRILDLAERAPRAKWTKLSARRLQNWGGIPRPEGLVPEALPQWQLSLIDRLMECKVFDADKRPNHVLLNQYRAGEGILAHKDGPIYYPLVAIISLGSPITLSFYTSLAESKRTDGDCISMLLQPRSLFLFSQQCYTDLFHGIVEVPSRCVSHCFISTFVI